MENLIKQFGGTYFGEKPQLNAKQIQAAISAAQDKLGVELPGDYIEFVSQYGGYGFDAEPAFSTGDGKRDIVNIVLGFSKSGSHGYDPVATLRRIEDRVPVGYLPIINDPGGNYVLLKIADGSVWFWDHEIAPDAADESALTHLADDIESFVAGWEATEELDEDEDEDE
jgi:hypothetical protein